MLQPLDSGEIEAALGKRSMQDVYDALDSLLSRTPKVDDGASG